jgi:exodeoxyribonuclease VII large subunit
MLRQRDPREVLRQGERSLEESRRRFRRDAALLRQRLGEMQLGVGNLGGRMVTEAQRNLRERQQALQNRASRLSALGPEQTLRRGYSICIDAADSQIIRDASQTGPGRPIKVLLSTGRLRATVEEASS